MSLDVAFNFRDTLGFVTDSAHEQFDRASLTYPAPAFEGTVYGWDADFSANARDRSNTVDRRLAGIVFQSNNGTQRTFRVDLPAPGVYAVHLALGDASFARSSMRVEVLDNTTSLFMLSGVATSGGHFQDATGVDLTTTTWPSSEAPQLVTFSTTTCFVKLGTASADADASALAHLRLVSTTAAVDEDSWNVPIVQPQEFLVSIW